MEPVIPILKVTAEFEGMTLEVSALEGGKLAIDMTSSEDNLGGGYVEVGAAEFIKLLSTLISQKS